MTSKDTVDGRVTKGDDPTMKIKIVFELSENVTIVDDVEIMDISKMNVDTTMIGDVTINDDENYKKKNHALQNSRSFFLKNLKLFIKGLQKNLKAFINILCRQTLYFDSNIFYAF
jgi:hypothetical protein